MIDYRSNTRANPNREGRAVKMTITPEYDTWNRLDAGPAYEATWRPAGHATPREVPGAFRPRRRAVSAHRSRRPAGSATQYRGTGVLLSRASHRPRPITPFTTVLLAVVAGAITLWLGLVAQAGGVVGETAEAPPSRLAVVQVQAGESLRQIAQRVSPDAPVSEVVDRIRQLNELESVAVDAGQTLIAPVG